MFLDVGFDGQEILMDELSGLLVFVGLGIQPSAGASEGSRTEVQQNGAVLLFSCNERLIDVLGPIYGHNSPPEVMIKGIRPDEQPPLCRFQYNLARPRNMCLTEQLRLAFPTGGAGNEEGYPTVIY